MEKYQILLFYKYIDIENPEEEKLKQKALCERLNLKCRTIIAKEGINGTLEGSVEDTERYIKEMQKDKRFKDIHFKKSEGTGKAFPRINVKVRDEIVALNLGEKDINPNVTTGKYITADELQELYESGDEFYVVDMRNDYEQKVGHFEDAILMPMANFRELPETLSEIEHLKDKLIVTTCTGGIRCEKASGFLVENGFTNVYQLYGGMHTYMERYPNQHFLGKLYVFDGRTLMGFNTDSDNHVVVGECERCGKQNDNYVDCAYIHCLGHRHLIVCKDCYGENSKPYCSEECEKADINAEYSNRVKARVEYGRGSI